MKKKKIGLCAVALLCMSGTAKAALPALKQDNTKVVNHAQITAAYKTNRPAVKNRLYTSQAVEAEILRVKKPNWHGCSKTVSPTHWIPPYTIVS